MKKKVKKNEKIKVKSAPIQEKQSGYHNDKMMKKSFREKGGKEDIEKKL